MKLSRPRTYERYSIVAELLELTATLCLLLWLLSGPSMTLRNFATHVSPHPWAVIALYSLGITALVSAVNLPISLFRGFTLPRCMKLSRQSFPEWVWDKVKGWTMGLVLGTAVLEVLYALLRWYPHMWWLYAALGFMLLTIVLATAAPVIFIPVFFRMTPLRNRILTERLRSLARKAKFRIKGIYEFDLGRKTKAVNAALTGLGRTRRILLSDTLLSSFTPGEIETVLAHELGHHVRSHLWKGILFNGIMTFIGLFIVDRSFSLVLSRFSFLGPHDVANFPLIVLILGIVGIISVPSGNAISRRMERTADIFSLQITERPRAFVSTMKKLARLNLANPNPHPLTEFFFYSHPPVRKRIALAQK